MPNRLALEASPYLLQHADNPVDWYPWGEEAFALARELDKPILLSVGYAACHWCHVMAHESFEDPHTAALMNEHFVNVKVDREERPDVDSIYMNAVVALTGQGGWPMTVVMAADGTPFFGGTYFPPAPRHGMPSFRQVLLSIVQAWQTRRQDIQESATQITSQLRQIAHGATSTGVQLDRGMLVEAVANVQRQYDPINGGFGRAPKFPQAMTIEFLLRAHIGGGDARLLQMAEHTLEKMARGGMYDQIGGGFARYSTDDRWLVPHFEKMLYDNALLSMAYLHAWRVTRRPLYRRIVEETLDWALIEMRHEFGGFYSSLDADSEGEEGKFYVWHENEIDEALGTEAPLFKRFFGVTPHGNWEGHNILHQAGVLLHVATEFGLTAEQVRSSLGQSRSTLYAKRARREWPGLDKKILTAWNGLMLASFAEAGRDLQRPDYLNAAVTNAKFLWEHLRQKNGRLLRSWTESHGAKLNAYLEDYAYLAQGLLALYQSTFDSRWYLWARDLVEIIAIQFSDRQEGGFFDTSEDHESLVYRPKDVQDNATPSGSAAAANVLLQVSLLSGDRQHWDYAVDAVSRQGSLAVQYPTGFAHWLCAADLILSDPVEVAIAGEPDASDARELIDLVFDRYRPNLVVAVGADEKNVPLLIGREQVNNRAAAYVCRQFTCKLPVTNPSDLRSLLP